MTVPASTASAARLFQAVREAEPRARCLADGVPPCEAIHRSDRETA